ncbi:MAG: NTP transferase domain-containing protein [Gemmatimonadales bacterium]
MIVATILAAGASVRMGRPKALLEYRGKTFLQNILDSTAALGLKCIVAVSDTTDKILSQHDLAEVTVVVNREPESGPIGSIRTAIAWCINHSVEAIVVWPVDLPRIDHATVESLVGRFRDTGLPIVVPTFEGRRGHPVIFGRAVFAELLSTPGDQGARAVVRADARRVAQVPVPDPAVLDRIDTPEAYEELLRRGDDNCQ